MSTVNAARSTNAACINCGAGGVIITNEGLHCNQCNHNWGFETEPATQHYVQNVLRRLPITSATHGVVPEKPTPTIPDRNIEKVKPDDLTLIDGIGGKTSLALNSEGVTTFAQLAALTPDAIRNMLAKHNVRGGADPDYWIAQAQSMVKV